MLNAAKEKKQLEILQINCRANPQQYCCYRYAIYYVNKEDVLKLPITYGYPETPETRGKR